MILFVRSLLQVRDKQKTTVLHMAATSDANRVIERLRQIKKNGLTVADITARDNNVCINICQYNINAKGNIYVLTVAS